MSSRSMHPLNALLLITETASGMFMHLSFSHPANALSPIDDMFEPRWTLSKFLEFQNSRRRMQLTPSPIVTDVRLLQPLNTLEPRFVIVSGISTLTSPVWSNTPSAML